MLSVDQSNLAGSRTQLSKFWPSSYSAYGFLCLITISVVTVAAGQLFLAKKGGGVLSLVDTYDLYVYFKSASWVVDGGRPYRDVPSEYPLIADLIFAAYRFIANIFSPGGGFTTFCMLWMAGALSIFAAAVYRIFKEAPSLAVLAWLAPAPIYFAVFRYDIYPALATLMAILAIRREAFYAGAIWFGVAIALKGYALFLIPAYCVFVLHRRNFISSVTVGVLAVAPMILALFATFLLAGSDGMLSSFKFHAYRLLNGESTYDAVNYLFEGSFIPNTPAVRFVSQLLQIGCALAAAAFRPKNFEQLILAFLFAVVGYISFSVFYSPQYVLWILPIACFSSSRAILILLVAFGWATYCYFPISYNIGERPLHAFIIIVTMLRFSMMYLAAKNAANATRPPQGNVSHDFMTRRMA
jgi:hypothetical protein